MIVKTRHTGLVVTDIIGSIEFYENLGLEAWIQQNEHGDFISQVVGLDNVELVTAKLKVIDGSVLELIEYKYHPAKATASVYDEMAVKVVELGGSIVNVPAISANGLVKVMYCHDLDGILIEMVEEL